MVRVYYWSRENIVKTNLNILYFSYPAVNFLLYIGRSMFDGLNMHMQNVRNYEPRGCIHPFEIHFVHLLLQLAELKRIKLLKFLFEKIKLAKTRTVI
jgi:hypothetical protein